MVSLIALSYTTNTTLAVLLLTIAVGLNAGAGVGYLVNHIDLSPNFAGTLMGITNSIANILSLLAPLVAGAIVNGKGHSDEVCISISRKIFLHKNWLKNREE